jgi:hypothetical protein
MVFHISSGETTVQTSTGRSTEKNDAMMETTDAISMDMGLKNPITWHGKRVRSSCRLFFFLFGGVGLNPH